MKMIDSFIERAIARFDRSSARRENEARRRKNEARLSSMNLEPKVIAVFMAAFEPVERRETPSTMERTSKGRGSWWAPERVATHVSKGYFVDSHGSLRADRIEAIA